MARALVWPGSQWFPLHKSLQIYGILNVFVYLQHVCRILWSATNRLNNVARLQCSYYYSLDGLYISFGPRCANALRCIDRKSKQAPR